MEAKANTKSPLFYKTDTQLTASGNIAVFRSLLRPASEAMPELKWPTELSYQIVREPSGRRGDLSKKLLSIIPDVELIDKITFQNKGLSNASPAINKSPLNPSKAPTFHVPDFATLLTNKDALNSKKALWIQSASSIGMTPLMEKTFEQVLIVSWSDNLLSTDKLTSIVKKWRPQYIFFTLDDKNINSRALEHFPTSGVFRA